jgi:hypothetical protein
MSRSCDYCEKISRKLGAPCIGIEPLLQFVVDGFQQLGAPYIVVEKHHPRLSVSGL